MIGRNTEGLCSLTGNSSRDARSVKFRLKTRTSSSSTIASTSHFQGVKKGLSSRSQRHTHSQPPI
uniref:Uncharacterized protein n=1 Tax=Moniliophthora roreri TaxID=221103 RepID=A0A0W0F9L3_MONRR